MDYSQQLIKLGRNGNNFINAIGLTSSAADFSSTINEIDYYSVEELVGKYPQLAPKFGITSVEKYILESDNLLVFAEKNGSVRIVSHIDTKVTLLDLNGKLVKKLNLTASQPEVLNLKPGVYFANGVKFALSN